MITLRVRSPQGVQRVQVAGDATFKSIYDQIECDGFFLSRDPTGNDVIDPKMPIKTTVQHGDFIFLHPLVHTDKVQPALDTGQEICQLDKELEKKDGRLKRALNPGMCRHGPGGMCIHCQPLEPWEVDKEAKHLPLYSYLRFLNVPFQKFLETGLLDTPITDKRCKHPSWPAAMCTHCQPQAVLLKRQPFRAVEHVEFQGHEGVESVVREWRETGLQRFGWLFGRYLPVSQKGLGVKVVCLFVYQPPQSSAIDGVQLLEDGSLQSAVDVAKLLDLELVGMIYTDLHDDGSGSGKVTERPYFISSPELCFIAQQQSARTLGCFGSRFVTCVVGGGPAGDIEVTAWQSSEQANYLLSKEYIAPSDDPFGMIVKQGELLHNLKNEYNCEVQKRAGPGELVPVEYFIVSLSHGFSAYERGVEDMHFPPLHLNPSPQQALDYLTCIPALHACTESNFNMLLYLVSKYSVPVSGLRDVKDPSELAVYGRLLQDIEDRQSSSGWVCEHCTFINGGEGGDCAMCGLPK